MARSLAGDPSQGDSRMNVDDITAYLNDASQLRIPKFDPEESPGLKIAALEDYMLKVSYHRGDLEQAIGWVLEAKHDARRMLDDVQGWEVHVPRGSQRTQEQVLDAKRKIAPQAFNILRDADYFLKRLERQVRRLEHDNDAVSRAYTLITGSA